MVIRLRAQLFFSSLCVLLRAARKAKKGWCVLCGHGRLLCGDVCCTRYSSAVLHSIPGIDTRHNLQRKVLLRQNTYRRSVRTACSTSSVPGTTVHSQREDGLAPDLLRHIYSRKKSVKRPRTGVILVVRRSVRVAKI